MTADNPRLVLIHVPIDKRYLDARTHFSPPLGLLAIKSYFLNNNNDSSVLIIDGSHITDLNKIIDDVLEFNPYFIGLSVQLLSYKNAIYISKRLKSELINVKIAAGGHHSTQLSDAIIQNQVGIIDFVVCGDGEKAMYQLCQNIPPEEINNLVYYDNVERKIIRTKKIDYNLDEFSDPYSFDFDWTPYLKKIRNDYFCQTQNRYFRIYSHKGCQYRFSKRRCVFCGRADSTPRYLSPTIFWERLFRIGLGKDDYVFDVGDDLLGNICWLNEVARVKEANYKNFEVKLGIFGRADAVTDEIAITLKRIGVYDVTIGFESGNTRVLKSATKGINNSDLLLEATRILVKNGIYVTPSYVLGLPGENRESLENTLSHAQSVIDITFDALGTPPNEIVANLLEPLPGSPAFNLLQQAYPDKYIEYDMIELEEIQYDYFRLIHKLKDKQEYASFRSLMSEYGNIINNLVKYSDSQGWLSDEINYTSINKESD